ncbi:MAG TPA: AsmA family protein, partial [Candidatus Bathyarchaeia archaeon]|nr:AsmA family protein [Candidatus Bathyarchaeia archaeon]
MKILKIFKWVGMIIAVLLVVLVVGRNMLVKWGAEIAVSSMTDLTLRIDKLNIGLFSTKLDIQGLKIYNPKGYQDPLMLNLPRFYVDYNLMEIIGGKLHLKEVKFHLNEFMLVKQKDGTSNIDSLKALASKKEGAAPEKAPEQKTPPEKKQLPIQIDSLELKLGQVVMKDYSRGGQPEVNAYQVNIDQTFKDITDINAFVTTLLLKHMSKFVTNA